MQKHCDIALDTRVPFISLLCLAWHEEGEKIITKNLLYEACELLYNSLCTLLLCICTVFCTLYLTVITKAFTKRLVLNFCYFDFLSLLCHLMYFVWGRSFPLCHSPFFSLSSILRGY